MTIQDDRQLVESINEQARLADRNSLIPFKGIVVEIGAGDYLGMVRVRRVSLEPTDVGRPFYYVVGAVPALDAEVWAMANFATGFVFGAVGSGGGGYDTPAEVLAALLTVDGASSGLDADLLDGVNGAGYAPIAHVGAGGAAHANVVAGGAAGFQTGADKTKLDSLSAQAIGLFKAHLSANQLNVANITETKVNYNSEAWDNNSWYNTSTVRYVPLLAGWYTFTAAIRFLPGVANNYVRLYLRVNGTTVHRLGQTTAIDTADVDCEGTSPPVFLDGVDDYVEVYMWHDFGVGTSDIIATTVETYFSGYFLGTT